MSSVLDENFRTLRRYLSNHLTLRILLVLSLLIGGIALGSYFWRGRLPHDVHPTDGAWLPGSPEPLSNHGILLPPDEADYRVEPFLREKPKKILLITIDTLRADHLSSYGYVKETSPFLDSLAAEGLKFTNTYAPMSKTLPAHVSLMTGLYPIQHNVRTNYEKLNDSYRTLAELLEQAGYKTAGFVSTNRHFTPGNLTQGFGVFNRPETKAQYFDPPWSDTAPRYNLSYRPASRTLDRARRWIESRPKSERQFVWIHLFDPHFPYAYRPAFHDPLRYQNRRRRENWLDFVTDQHKFDIRQGPRTDQPEKDPYISTYRLYDGEIRYVDAQLEEFYGFLNEAWSEAPLSIITSDHGEGMGNHRWWGHSKYIYNEQIRVPLIVHHPDGKWDRDMDTINELNDLYTTIAREARVPFAALSERNYPPLAFPLQLLTSGQKHRGFGTAFASRTTFQEDYSGYWSWMRWRWRELTTDYLRHPLSPDHRWTGMAWPGQQHVLLDQSKSYVYNTALRDEFYDQRKDFYQTNNRISQTSDWHRYGATLNEVLTTLRDRQGPGGGTVDESTRRKLKGLGYVN